MSAANRIRSMRVDSGLSQGSVAKAVGKSQGWLSLIEGGYSTPSNDEIAAIEAVIRAAIRNRASKFERILKGEPMAVPA